jgi:peptide/nickel transport system permease protein
MAAPETPAAEPASFVRGALGVVGAIAGSYAVRRLVLAVPLLLAVSVLVFAVVDAFPGDPCLIKLGQRANATSIERCRDELGLDRPWLARYGEFVAGAARLDFGQDFFTGEDVGAVMAKKLHATVELSLAALLIAWLLGTWLGTRSALRPGGWSDVLGQLLALGGTSFPVFWLGMLLIMLFGVRLAWLPFTGWTAGEIGPGVDYRTGFLLLESLVRGEWTAVGRALHHLVLPAAALSTIPLAVITRMTRSAMLEELGRDYVTTARAKGVPERRVIGRHVRRNALIPVVTVTGLQLGTLLSGAVLTETIFSWPGIGKWVYDAILGRDYPIVQGGTLIIALIFVFFSIIVDLSYALLDPRIHYE